MTLTLVKRPICTLFSWPFMPDDVRLGEFEELVLLAVAGLGAHAYSVQIQQHLEQRADRAAAMGALYTALGRLEKKGYVRSQMSEVTHRRGGKRKRVYCLTDTGAEALHAVRSRRDRLWADWQPNLGLSS
ncbi:MAG: hypothetical protein RhofKO_03080 [Rhodothermales bacterium]